MYAALMAFIHHLAAFTVVATLAVEVALFQPPFSMAQARRLQRIDSIFGVAAGVVLVVGLLRVVYFEKGPAYLARHVLPMKFAAFVVASLISIYPTVTFLAWNRNLRAGEAPQISATQVQRVRRCLQLELASILVILACAAFMARGFGYR
jgi:putative membrane protein